MLVATAMNKLVFPGFGKHISAWSTKKFIILVADFAQQYLAVENVFVSLGITESKPLVPLL